MLLFAPLAHFVCQPSQANAVTVIASIDSNAKSMLASHMNSNKFWAFNLCVAFFLLLFVPFSLHVRCAAATSRKTCIWFWHGTTDKPLIAGAAYHHCMQCMFNGHESGQLTNIHFEFITFMRRCIQFAPEINARITMNNSCARWIWINQNQRVNAQSGNIELSFHNEWMAKRVEMLDFDFVSS